MCAHDSAEAHEQARLISLSPEAPVGIELNPELPYGDARVRVSLRTATEAIAETLQMVLITEESRSFPSRVVLPASRYTIGGGIRTL